MCGINGIWNFNKDTVDKKIIKDMNKILEHRGPNQDGFYIDGNIGLGHKRLSIIDLSIKGKQPMHNEDETLWIVYNGEIYNFMKLRKNLEKKGYKFNTDTDTEVILYLFEEYGESCVTQLSGMFAFAIWDTIKKKMFIVRDRLGKKPFFYYYDKKRFIFSSEIKAILLNPDIKRIVNLKALNHYLSFLATIGADTAFKGIKRLEPGHYMVINNNKLKITQYWDVKYKESNKSEAYYLENVRKLLDDSVKQRLVSDVPLGAFLSGGIDSSVIVALMAKYSDEPVKTFTIKFSENSFDESKHARIISDKYSTEHREFTVEPSAISILPKLVWAFDEPFADSSAIPSYYVSRETKKHVTVAINGDGGDENFVGYPKYQAEKVSRMLSPLKPVIKNLARVTQKLPESTSANSKTRILKRFLTTSSQPTSKRYFNWIQIFNDEMKEKLYTPNLRKINKDNKSLSVINNYFDKCNSNDYNKQLYTDIKLYLASDLLVKIDRTSMMNSLETRSPFLDHKLVEFSATIPFKNKMKRLSMKYLLKKSLKDLLPKEILNKPKQGFSVPIGKWFKHELRDVSEQILLSKRFQKRGYFKTRQINKILQEHRKGKVDHGHRIYTLLNLELWHRTFIDSDNLKQNNQILN